MLDFVNQITDKPDWHKKVFDEQIVQKWKDEGVRFDDTLHDLYLSEKMFEVVCRSSLANPYELTAHSVLGRVARKGRCL